MSATRTSRAWSCTVRLVVEDEATLEAAADDLAVVLARVGTAASRFDARSEISRLNDRSGQTVALSPLLADMLDSALLMADRTGGACDPTVGAAVIAAGYDRDIAEVLTDPAPAGQAGPAADWTQVEFDRERGTVRVPVGVLLDLGATGKAYAADLAARTIHEQLGTAVLVEIGGDLAVAGDRADGWTVRVAEREDGAGQLVTVHSGGLATSTTTIRRWGAGRHHLIDPATGAPAEGPWRTATVSGASALLANAESTAALVRGEAWSRTCRMPARLIAQDGTARTVNGWPPLRPVDPILSYGTDLRQITVGGAR